MRTGYEIREGSAELARRAALPVRTFAVRVDVPDAPYLGACTFDVDSTTASGAEREALRRMYEKWACGAAFRARVQVSR